MILNIFIELWQCRHKISFAIQSRATYLKQTNMFSKTRFLTVFFSFGQEEVSERARRDEAQAQRVSRSDRKLPDLRNKLKRRGLLRRNRSDASQDENIKHVRVRPKLDENGASHVSKKIYVKPSVVFDDSSVNKPFEKQKTELPRALIDGLSLTRLVEEEMMVHCQGCHNPHPEKVLNFFAPPPHVVKFTCQIKYL